MHAQAVAVHEQQLLAMNITQCPATTRCGTEGGKGADSRHANRRCIWIYPGFDLRP